MALSPMMRHYLQTKEEYADTILFYRLGDFYEMFFEDALLVSKELELTLTGKDCGLEERAPMCGVPYHAADVYIKKLIEKGHKVAICEQMEDPKTAKGIVRREVIRVVTPGTVMDQNTLDDERNNYICCVAADGTRIGFAVCDISTGKCMTTELDSTSALNDEISRFAPSEILCNPAACLGMISESKETMVTELPNRYFGQDACETILKEHFHCQNLNGLGLDERGNAVLACGALLQYLYDTQKSGMGQITGITPYEAGAFMFLDRYSRRNLELTETLRDKQKKGSLLGVLDHTKTAMGARLLRSSLERPLLNRSRIEARLDAVEEMNGRPMDRDEIREYLDSVYDLERLISRIVSGNANARDLISFKSSLAFLPAIKDLIGGFQSEKIHAVFDDLDPCTDLYHLIDRAVQDEPPFSLHEGGLIKDGYNETVDQYRSARNNGKQWILDLEAKERERTGIRNLRIRYNKVFGYYLEVIKSAIDLVPDDYIRKQTLSNAERYTTERLQELEDMILGAEEKLNSLEYSLFDEVRQTLSGGIGRIQKTASAISSLDVICALSYVSVKYRYVRPSINENGVIDIRDGRHPVVERLIRNDLFIPKDTYLDNKGHRVSIITGPNMAGKSTYMRQCALIALMAQMGCFVPAKSANICISDRIFTRVGASDDLAAGQSTFMVEMTEVANILRNATKDSLLILDEIGRGTSTFDGLAIAWAVIEYIADPSKIGAKTLFATHYHELTELEGKMYGVKNYCIAVKEKGDDIIFLRRIIRGGADKSYGIQVARLAGVPSAVTDRAKELVEKLVETDMTDILKDIAAGGRGKTPKQESDFVQLSLFEEDGREVPDGRSGSEEPGAGTSAGQEDAGKTTCVESRNGEILHALKEADLSNMTPLEALNLLYRLQEKLAEQE